MLSIILVSMILVSMIVTHPLTDRYIIYDISFTPTAKRLYNVTFYIHRDISLFITL